MPALASRGFSALPENHGKRRENGTERTSATVVAPEFFNRSRKCSAGRLECPMVNRSKSAAAVIDVAPGSVARLRSRGDALVCTLWPQPISGGCHAHEACDRFQIFLALAPRPGAQRRLGRRDRGPRLGGRGA